MKIFDNNELEVFEYENEDYEPTMHFGEWRVAFMNCSDARANVTRYERHNLTDEVFVLLEVQAALMIGDEKKIFRMEKNKIYNIKKGVWHGSAMSRDAKLLVVENQNTSRDNTDIIFFEEEFKVEF